MKLKMPYRSILVISAFVISFYGRRALGLPRVQGRLMSAALTYAWWIMPSLTAALLISKPPDVLRDLGLSRGLLKALVFAALAVIPMLAGAALIGRPNFGISPTDIILGGFAAGLMEEYLFRGFLFGLLWRKCSWGFIPAVLSGALVFGMGHLYQGVNTLQSAGIFTVTALGAVWFAWLYIEWDDNLWVPIFLHILMNLSWLLFDVSNNALGGLASNVFRVATIGTSVVWTLLRARRPGLKIRGRFLWRNAAQ